MLTFLIRTADCTKEVLSYSGSPPSRSAALGCARCRTSPPAPLLRPQGRRRGGGGETAAASGAEQIKSDSTSLRSMHLVRNCLEPAGGT